MGKLYLDVRSFGEFEFVFVSEELVYIFLLFVRVFDSKVWDVWFLRVEQFWEKIEGLKVEEGVELLLL